MNDADIRRLERERDAMPCRATCEALDRARARMGDGPWLPQSGDLAWETFLVFDHVDAWGGLISAEHGFDDGPGFVIGLDDDGIIRFHDPRQFDPHPDEARVASLDAILMRNVVPVAGRSQSFVNRTPE